MDLILAAAVHHNPADGVWVFLGILIGALALMGAATTPARRRARAEDAADE